ncbi:MBL fold metallo-hydrolase [Patescibacteria group bacterium]|nr:MBL fold metallo-hydrolase [Patescibacteria group bacterium]
MEISLSKGDIKIKGKNSPALVSNAKLSVGEFVVPGPGEFEINGVDVVGVAVDSRTIYRVNVDNVLVVYLDNLDRKLTEQESNQIGPANVLLIPVETLSADAAAEVVAQLEPQIVVPIGNSENRAKFLKQMGTEQAVAQAKLVTSAEKLPETTTVVVLE